MTAIRKIYCKRRFRGFGAFETIEIPEKTRWVVLLGGNGSGKSTVLEALERFARPRHQHDREYWGDGTPEVEFHRDKPADIASHVLIRSAHRNAIGTKVNNLTTSSSASDQSKKLNSSDANESYYHSRIITAAAEPALEEEDSASHAKLKEFRHLMTGLREAYHQLFPNIEWKDPSSGQFWFDVVGVDSPVTLAVLSSGERAVFDLLLSVVLAQPTATDGLVLGLDEPEAHLAPELHQSVLRSVESLSGDISQIWIATHSFPMLTWLYKKARDKPGEVLFLDMPEGTSIQDSVTIESISVMGAVYPRMLEVAADAAADLLAPRAVVLCEGQPNQDAPSGRSNFEFDQKVFTRVFRDDYPEISFVSIGGEGELKSAKAIAKAMGAHSVVTVTDRDQRTDQEIEEDLRRDVRILNRGDLESYLIDDVVVTKWFELNKSSGDDTTAISQMNGTSSKSKLGQLYDYCKSVSENNLGRTKHDFARQSLSDALAQSEVKEILVSELGLAGLS